MVPAVPSGIVILIVAPLDIGENVTDPRYQSSPAVPLTSIASDSPSSVAPDVTSSLPAPLPLK